MSCHTTLQTHLMGVLHITATSIMSAYDGSEVVVEYDKWYSAKLRRLKPHFLARVYQLKSVLFIKLSSPFS